MQMAESSEASREAKKLHSGAVKAAHSHRLQGCVSGEALLEGNLRNESPCTLACWGSRPTCMCADYVKSVCIFSEKDIHSFLSGL